MIRRKAVLRQRIHRSILAMALIAGFAGSATPAHADTPLSLKLTLNQFATGVTHNSAGANMPSYLGTSATTTYQGDPRVYRTPADGLTSQTIKLPASQLGGPGAEQWDWSWGFVTGAFVPYVAEAHAGPMYLWSEDGGGFVRSGGDQISTLEVRLTDFHTYEVPATPSGRTGTWTWRTFPEWRQVLKGTTTESVSADSNGESVRTPVPTTTHNQMYVDQAELYASGGDIVASGSDQKAPTYVFHEPEPAGTVQNLVGISYTVDGPWKDYMDVTADFDTGMDDPSAGEYRLPVNVTLHPGGFLPERVDAPGQASPQYTIPVTFTAIPLLADETGRAQETQVVANVKPGTTRVVLLGLRQPDGSMRSERLVLDKPGQYSWVLRDGELVPQSQRGASVAPSTAFAQSWQDANDSPAASQAATDASTDPADAPGLYGGPDGDDTCRVGTDEAGRPELQNLVFDGTPILQSYHVSSVRTPSGVVDLGSSNEDVPPVLINSAMTPRSSATGVYVVDGNLVVVRFWCQGMVGGWGDYAGAYISSHSLDSAPHPHSYLTTLRPAAGSTIYDAVEGPVTRATRYLPNELTKRLVVKTGNGAYTVGGYYGGQNLESVTNEGEPARGQPLGPDPVITTEDVDMPVVSWGAAPVIIEPTPVPGPPPGVFTGVKIYKILDPFGGGQGVGPPQETRDLDGADEFGIAFSARYDDGTPVQQGDVAQMFIGLYTLTGQRLFAGEVPAYWTPDGGGSWGASFIPFLPLPPMDVLVYATATTGSGTITKQDSPGIAADQWAFRINRIPVTVADATGDTVSGTTAAAANVRVSIPELGVSTSTTSDTNGVFNARLDLSDAPPGDYQVEVRAATKGDRGVQDPVMTVFTGDPLPDDAAGFGVARLQWAAGGEAPDRHGTTLDRNAAVSFLQTRSFAGRFDGNLRSTAWALTALHGASDPAQATYPSSLTAPGGFSWRAGEAANAAATGLVAQAEAALGTPLEANAVDATRFLLWNGGARPSSSTEISTVEATGQLATALAATDSLPGFDPWWRAKILSYLENATGRTALEEYYRVLGAEALGGSAVPGAAAGGPNERAAEVAYRILLGRASPSELGAYQLQSGSDAGGVTASRTGDTPDALSTALALFASS